MPTLHIRIMGLVILKKNYAIRTELEKPENLELGLNLSSFRFLVTIRMDWVPVQSWFRIQTENELG